MSNLRLLLIEDNEDDSILILRELARGGYHPDWYRVETADAMRAALREREWDLILSDFSLPTFTGPAALSVLKESGLDIPFIIVSGTVGEETAVAALKAGAHDFLSKNNLNRLLPAIDREVREAKGRAERRATQARLRESEEALAAVFGSSPLPIVTIDVSGIVTALNASALQAFGFNRDDVIGRAPDFVHLNGGGPTWGERVLRGESLDRCEATGVRGNGETMHLLLFASPLHGPDGGVTGGVAILNDITSQRALEEQLRQAQKMEAIGQLAGGVAHDFNNILTAIQGFATMLQQGLSAQSEHQGDVDGILDAASRAAAFTRQLLAFSRKQVTQPEHIDPNDLVNGMLKMLTRVIGAAYTIEFEAGTGLDPVFADRGQLEQVLMNLVVNARDAMHSGGTIGLRTERMASPPAERFPAVDVNGSFIVFSVADTGTGIDPKDVSHIFEPFFTTKDSSRGTGLGLSTVYGIVTQHGGFISIDTRPGHGTRFSVHLPEQVGATVRRANAQTTERADTRTTARVLVVEDDDIIRSLMERALRRAGYSVTGANNGTDALQLLQDPDAFDVLITDLLLPGVGGTELIDHVRKTAPRMRTMLVSGYAARDLELSPDITFMEKPFPPNALITAVRTILSESTSPNS